MAKQNQYFPQSVPHPGETLDEKLKEMEMGPKEFALRTGKPEKTIIAVLKGDSAVTPDMAVQFENVTKIPANFWMNHQRGYDEYIARVKQQETIEQAIEWAKSFPLTEMIKKKWLPAYSTIKDRAASLLSFFAVANHVAWEDYYFKQELKVQFRISLHNTSNPYSISAWLRQGELQASNIDATEYNEKAFKTALDNIKSLMATQPDGYFNELQEICKNVGVKVVYTPCIAKAPINGATRWLNDTPLIQMTGRYKRNDIFWFTFFHEAGHILLHGKKDIFLEKV
ncbi:MAG: HigA family addiction module antidote protein, partial [Bacteroidetes bacterium]|nr:HigA family addiction module antidote protein [Bacteroidota bacterium]